MSYSDGLIAVLFVSSPEVAHRVIHRLGMNYRGVIDPNEAAGSQADTV